MSTLLDIIGAFIAGSVLLLALIGTNANLIESNYRSNLMLVTEQNVVDISRMIEQDIRKIGFGVDSLITSITMADSDRISFITDIDNNGMVDSVLYYTGDVSELDYTDNPDDRVLYRVINGQTPLAISAGITKLHFSYYDSTGSETSVLKNIRNIGIELEVESIVPLRNDYIKTYIRKKIVPRNLLE